MNKRRQKAVENTCPCGGCKEMKAFASLPDNKLKATILELQILCAAGETRWDDWGARRILEIFESWIE